MLGRRGELLAWRAPLRVRTRRRRRRSRRRRRTCARGVRGSLDDMSVPAISTARDACLRSTQAQHGGEGGALERSSAGRAGGPRAGDGADMSVEPLK